MKVKTISPFTILFSSIAVFIFGVIVLFNSKFIATLTLGMISLYLLIIGVLHVSTYIFNRKNTMLSKLSLGILYLILSLSIKLHPKFFRISAVRIIGIYAFLNFLALITSSLILYKNKVKGWVSGSLISIISLGFSIVLLFHPQKYMLFVSKLAGIYVILYSITLFADFLKEFSAENIFQNKLTRKFRIGLPLLYSAFIPQKLFEKVNEFVKPEYSKNTCIDNKDIINTGKIYSTVDIFIHLAPDCANGFGHIDISFENITYSYGTYDSSSNKLFTLVSSGVLIEVETNKYIEILNTQFNRSLIGFTLALTKEQHNLIKDSINKIKYNCYEWRCPAQLNPTLDYKDETNIMYREANCKYYKFKSGYFKTYFTLTANCVKLADTIVGAAGLDLLSVNGIITPGTYYNYLDTLFKRKNTIVIKKKIFKKQINNFKDELSNL